MSDDILSRIGNTPLIRMVRITPSRSVPLFGKCEFLNPGGSVKDRIAKAILEVAESRGADQ
jgi:cysteine synthase